jgi:lipopolysaccharide assembly outer membrane protein LptD (OstA)
MKRLILMIFAIFIIFSGVITISIEPAFAANSAKTSSSTTAVNDASKTTKVADENTKQDSSKQTNSTPVSKKSTSETLIIKTGHLSSTDQKIEGSGGMTLVKGKVKITADKGSYYEKEKKAEISGDVVLTHDKGEISSKEMEAWLDTDRYIFQKDVKMTQKLDDGQFTLESPYLELEQKDNSFTAEKGVTIKYKGRTLKADKAVYDDQQQTLNLTSNVYIEKENGDWVKCQKSTFYLKTEEFTAEDNVELQIDLSKE